MIREKAGGGGGENEITRIEGDLFYSKLTNNDTHEIADHKT